MAELVRDLRTYARTKNRRFLVVAQNGAHLGDEVPAYYGWIDGISHESVTFAGRAGSDWDAETTGDVPQSHEAATRLIAQLQKYRARGLTVFTLDYALHPQNIASSEHASRAAGFVPFVSRTPLDRLPSRAP